jgi:hypothetical protein
LCVVKRCMLPSFNKVDHEDITELLFVNPTFSQKTIPELTFLCKLSHNILFDWRVE